MIPIIPRLITFLYGARADKTRWQEGVRLVKLLRTCSGEDDLVDEFLMKQIFIAIDKMHQEAGDPPPAKQPSYRFKKRKRRR